MSRQPVAVLISDVHYSLNNLQLADASLRMAIEKSNDLDIPLVIAGDLHDTKANLRAECVNAMVKTFGYAEFPIWLWVGNHDKINEKSKEHSLNFLKDYAFIVEEPRPYYIGAKKMYAIPYHHDVEELRAYLKTIPKGSILIMHQGLTKALAGEYIQDKSALNPEDVAGFRVISGHYHARQTIKLPYGGIWDYIGNPFTTTFGEASDPPKGFQILYLDGTLEFVPTNLRKHVIYEVDCGAGNEFFKHSLGDLVWLKVKGTKEQLSKFKKPSENFRVDLIPIDSVSQVSAENLTQPELLDSIIDGIQGTSDQCKARLKKTWKDLI